MHICETVYASGLLIQHSHSQYIMHVYDHLHILYDIV